jgi:hypothetical protein
MSMAEQSEQALPASERLAALPLELRIAAALAIIRMDHAMPRDERWQVLATAVWPPSAGG